jgi:hypothetical protein
MLQPVFEHALAAVDAEVEHGPARRGGEGRRAQAPGEHDDEIDAGAPFIDPTI